MSISALDLLSSEANLRDTWKEYWSKAKTRAPGVDGLTPKQFNDNIPFHIAFLRKQLKGGYTYSKLRGIPVPKKDPTKCRVICIPTVYDRIVQRSVLRVIEGRAAQLRIVNDVSFGFVKDSAGRKRGAPAARDAAIKHRQLKPWAFKADISAFFDGIQRDELIERFQKAFSLKSLTPLVDQAIRCEVEDREPHLRRALIENNIRAGRGLRQGMPLSPILSNFLLRDFDRCFAARGYDLVRYADDLLVLASSRKECEVIAEMTAAELGKLKLTLSTEKTAICAPDESVEFLGMELRLNPTTSTYSLMIADQQLVRIKEQFTAYHDLDFTIGKQLNASKLLARLDNMKAGYRVAYGVADNYQALNRQLDQWGQNCITKLYASIFTAAAVAKLTPRQRSFLMIA